MASAPVACTLALEIFQILLATACPDRRLRRGCSGHLCGNISGLSWLGFFAKKAIGLTPAADATVTKHRRSCGDAALNFRRPKTPARALIESDQQRLG